MTLICATTLVSCSTDRAEIVPTATSPSATGPVFQSKNDAAKHTESLYRTFLSRTDQLAEATHPNFLRLREVASERLVANEVEGAHQVKNAGLVTRGATKLLTFQIQRTDLASGRTTAYACVDLSDVKIYKDGESIDSSSRPDRQTTLVTFVSVSGRLIVDKDDAWSGDSTC